ncbi:MAG: thiamine pyrophosphate-dependent enzyme, partial [Planctomycetota bacterium]|nr:thiamine pyrophosphate-dependent enzyme [Planctomycetota bacterium]
MTPTRPVTDVCSHGLLEQITSPADLRALEPEDLPRVADEIREYLVELIMRLGGHFGSNLGNVELTLALHYVYESPDDAIVWDVSHGCYPHKIITGRREKFSTLRTAGGLSGFLSPAESEHDLATTGHAGTGLSTALGIAWARRYQKNPRPVVAVVGDGSIPSGLSLEALNHVGGHDLSLTIVLNDNQWSIDPTPGALSQVLRDCREGIRRGDFFELLGVRYLGPVDGHDLSLLLELFREAKSRRGPTLIHLVTVKGKGFPEAEEDPYRYHAVSPQSTTGAKGTKGATFSAVFGEALTALARNDPRIVAVCAGMMGGTGLKTFHE